jgi:hypothetical protein
MGRDAMTAARRPSAASIERALVEWYRAGFAWKELVMSFKTAPKAAARLDRATAKLIKIAARLAGRRGKK